MTSSQNLQGLDLEQFLINFSRHVFKLATDAGLELPASVIQTLAIEITRHQLAGFSKDQIIEEFGRDDQRDLCLCLHDVVQTTLSSVQIRRPGTSESFNLGPGAFAAEVAAGASMSIQDIRVRATMLPMHEFSEGHYQRCAVTAAAAAGALGRHLFYQLWYVGHTRAGDTEAATEAGVAARNGLQLSPWHGRLMELSLGEVTADQLLATAKSPQEIVQVLCFDGLRLFSAGNRTEARRVLEAARARAQGLGGNTPIETFLAAADLARTGASEAPGPPEPPHHPR